MYLGVVEPSVTTTDWSCLKDAAVKQAGRNVDQLLSVAARRTSRHVSTGRRRLRRLCQVRRKPADRYRSDFSGVRLQRGDDRLGDCTRQRWTHQPGRHHRVLGDSQDYLSSVHICRSVVLVVVG